MSQQLFYMKFDEQNSEMFFNNLRALMEFWKRDISIHITDDALEEIKQLCNKQRIFWNEETGIGKLTVKLKNKEFIDIIYNSKNDVESIGFGPMSNKKKRQTYTPYKKKPISRKLYIFLKKTN